MAPSYLGQHYLPLQVLRAFVKGMKNVWTSATYSAFKNM